MSRRQDFFAAGMVFLLICLTAGAGVAGTITLYYPPEWKAKPPEAKAIADALSQSSGLAIQPRIAESYPEMIAAFSKGDPVLVYVGSFVQALLHARGLSVPLAQAKDGKEFYTSVLISPAPVGTDPAGIVREAKDLVSYSKGTSSGESGAKAATDGAASVAANNHGAAVNAMKAGKAKCAFVKSWWWEGNRGNFPGMNQFTYPDVSDKKHPDNVLSANKAVSAAEQTKIKEAASKNSAAFKVSGFSDFDAALLEPTLSLMKKGKIDPKAYSW
ncbi:MAG TPA: PhnD/SsuA/transferrin family substrate-binding protein [Thermodesulfobacteriota bacterium]|nr:PhnD/SsuA/transferrin family substrate-binding protein [Thermodesulfobacteriota bacterium]